MSYKHPGTLKICEKCGKEFHAPTYRADTTRFCSIECRRNGIMQTCLNCGKEFYLPGNRIKNGIKTEYCSKECRHEASTMIVKCATCGVEFRTHHKNAKNNYCSAKCRYNKPVITNVCERCGKTFQVKPYLVGVQRFCSNKCRGGGKVTLTCEYCGKEFQVYPYRIKDGVVKYCSNDCRFQASHIKKICPICKKEFFTDNAHLSYNENYCSNKCRIESTRIRVLYTCNQCGKQFESNPSRLRDYHVFCSKECHSAFIRIHGSPKKIQINRDKLRSLYIEQDLSLAEVAKIFDCSTTTISTRLKEYNIEAHDPGWAHRRTAPKNSRLYSLVRRHQKISWRADISRGMA